MARPAPDEHVISEPTPSATRQAVKRLLARPETHVGLGAAILVLDWLTGPLLLFPILFVIPVCLSAWYYDARWAHALAVLLPAGRLLIAELVDRTAPLGYSIANAAVRASVLLLLAHLVARTARLTRELESRVSGLVTICAWSRTILHDGEWVSFEEYLRRRFGVETTHGISPAELEKMRNAIDAERGAP